MTRWLPDHLAAHCYACDSAFWLASRKHHCRCHWVAFRVGWVTESELWPLTSSALCEQPFGLCFYASEISPSRTVFGDSVQIQQSPIHFEILYGHTLFRFPDWWVTATMQIFTSYFQHKTGHGYFDQKQFSSIGGEPGFPTPSYSLFPVLLRNSRHS